MPARTRRTIASVATALLALSAAAGTAQASPGQAASRTGAAVAPTTRDYAQVGYFIQWGIYGRNFLVKNLDTSGIAAKLTHINYAFGNVSADGRCFEANIPGQGDAWADYQTRFSAEQTVSGVADEFSQPLAGNFNQLRQLKAKYPQLRVHMALGGWTWSKYFSDAALTEESRRAFVSSCIDLFIKGDLPVLGEPQGGPGVAAGVFDGFDLDWEWPGSEGNAGNIIRPEDKQNFTLLLAEFRRQLDAYGAQTGKHYGLTAFLPAAPSKIDAGFEVDRIFDYLDFATVQGYDFHGTWEATTNHQSQLFSPRRDPEPARFSLDLAVGTLLDRGAPAPKIVIGIPYYGRGWTGVPSTNRGLYQPSTGPAAGTWEAGVDDYKVLKTKPGVRFRDLAHGAYWFYDGSNWWSYDDPLTVARKAAYVKVRGLGGTMVWSLDADDATGSLTTAIHGVLR
ncbi:MAG TPA: glycoside hydrolase family 18 protein [Actinomycetes bacterium]|nr:glycoside hydrolase family 18 protein [Actinomycetes bacterium]